MPEASRTFLGLTHNPFTRPGDAFYERAERKTCLEQLRHLSQWSRRVLLVSGPSGVGKSVLFRRLPGVVEEDARVVSIEGALFATVRELVAEVGRGFGVQTGLQAAPALIVRHIAASLAGDLAGDLAGEGERPAQVVLIDDAHRLEHRAVDALMDLAARCPVRIVLFGEASLRDVVEAAAARRDVPWHEMRLTGFTDEHVVDYLEWRFRQARYRGRLPFTPEKVRDIAREARGLPGRVDTLASDALVDLETHRRGSRTVRIPGVHRSAALLIAALVVFVWALVSAPADDDAAMDVAASRDGEEPSVALATGGDASNVVEDAGAVPRGPAEQVAEPVPERVAEAGVKPPARPVTPAVDSQPPGPRDARWLLAQSPSRWTVQIVTLSSASGVQSFIDRQDDPGKFASFGMQRGGRQMHVVVWGLFATEAEALAAARALPPKLVDLKPWVRPLAQIQANLRT